MKYEVWFKLVNESPEVNLQKPEFLDAINAAIRNFNSAGETARNGKKIYDQKIQPSVMKLYFTSDIALETPTKSFRNFSKDLIGADAFRELVVGGRLLQGVYVGTISEDATEQEETSMSDEQMLTTLLHWCMGKELQSAEEKKNKLAALAKIKEIILECAMLSQ